MASASPKFENGQKVLVWHGGDDVWHARLVLGHVVGSCYIIITPDKDVYEEDYGSKNDDIHNLRVCPSRTSLPTGIDAANVCYLHRSFPVMSSIASSEKQHCWRSVRGKDESGSFQQQLQRSDRLLLSLEFRLLDQQSVPVHQGRRDRDQLAHGWQQKRAMVILVEILSLCEVVSGLVQAEVLG